MPNDLLQLLGLQGWKPLAAALLLPPLPLLALMLAGGWLARRRALWGFGLMLTGAAGLWLSSTTAVGEALQRQLLAPVHALTSQDLRQLKQDGPAGAAIVVLGAGRETWAPEYGGPNLNPWAIERLRYGLWLARETGLPVAFSGGIGHARSPGPTEAELAAQLATRDFGRPLKWTETASRDTRENAELTVAALRTTGVRRLVVVTHGWHMRRSLRAFEHAVARQGGGLTLVPAPMGLAADDSPTLLRWLPSVSGFALTRHGLREVLGLLAGA